MKNPPEKNPVNLHIVRVGKRLIDDGNIPSGTKYLIDAIVRWKHAVDDSRKWMRVSFDQRKCEDGEAPCMEITLSVRPSWPHGGKR